MRPTPSEHRLRLGLPGYLIPFAPLAFGPQRQAQPRRPASPPAFLPISTDFTPTPAIPSPSTGLKSNSFKRSSTVKPWNFTLDLLDRLRPLYAQ